MKRIWKSEVTVEQLNRRGSNTMVDHLDIRFTEIGPDYLQATMPVDHRTNQPIGLLHGGASVVLAETLGSVAGVLCVDIRKQYCVGLEVNANHLRGVRSGRVMGTASPIHLGRKTQVWQIGIIDEHGRKVTASRLTLAVLDWGTNAPGLEERLEWLTQ
ncbi:MAG: hotdog fold thioesterase [Bacteroidetes bacterium]|nr:hotdog fold thioesterase [Bacteroidota bacterium]MCY4204610.1 hotdog fold thioesterase [Bacteroidota bacterium]